jgi:hypothetical protein
LDRAEHEPLDIGIPDASLSFLRRESAVDYTLGNLGFGGSHKRLQIRDTKPIPPRRKIENTPDIIWRRRFARIADISMIKERQGYTRN